MQKSRINLLMEQIANEIKVAERKNRELYASAVDIEDEELSLKIQNESYLALRNMRGLKAAMDTFSAQLDKSGIMKYDFGESDSPGIETRSGSEVFISHEHSPIIVGESTPAPVADIDSDMDDNEEDEESDDEDEDSFLFGLDEDEDDEDDEDEDDDSGESPVTGIIGELSKSLGEINSDDQEEDEDDDIDMDMDIDIDDEEEEIEEEIEEEEEEDDDFELSSSLDELPEESDEESDEDMGDLADELNDLAESLDELDEEIAQDEDEDLEDSDLESSFETDFGFDFDDAIVFDEIEFVKEEEPGIEHEIRAIIEEIDVPQEEDVPQEDEPAFAFEPEPEPELAFEPEPEPEPEKIEIPIPVIQPMPIAAPVAQKAEEPDDDFSGFGMMAAEPGIYSSRTPAKFAMFGRRVDVRDWADMLVKVCEILILKNPYTVAQFDKYHDLNPLGNTYFSYSQGEIQHIAKKLSNGLWIELQRTPDDIVMLCKKVLELCGYPRSELEIEFVD